METSLLKQQIEFLQFQLDDAKSREGQQKSMYETMLKSLEQPNHSEELESIKYKHQLELKKLEDDKNCKILDLVQKVSKLKRKKLELHDKLKVVEAESLRNIERSSNEIQLIKACSAKMQNDINDLTETLERYKEKCRALKTQQSSLIVATQSELAQTQQKASSDLQDLQALHNIETASLKSTILAQEHKLASISSSSCAPSLQSSLACIKSHSSSLPSEVQFSLRSLLSFYDPLSSTHTEINQSASPRHSRSRTLVTTETSPYFKPLQENQLSDTKFKHSERILAFAAAIECECCKFIFPTAKFYDHLLICINQNEISAVDKLEARPRFVERMEEQISSLKLTLGKLKNQRDKARIAADKLLVALKQTKLELAVAEENAGRKQMELMREIKQLVGFIMGIKKSACLSHEALLEIDDVVNNAAKLFGGKIFFRGQLV